jgi:hypothetical protein
VNPISFSDLHDRLAAAGLAVGVERSGRGHVITIVDPDSLREIRFPVAGAAFDRAAGALAASARLREHLGTPPIREGAVRVTGRWPELAALAVQ